MAVWLVCAFNQSTCCSGVLFQHWPGIISQQFCFYSECVCLCIAVARHSAPVASIKKEQTGLVAGPTLDPVPLDCLCLHKRIQICSKVGTGNMIECIYALLHILVCTCNLYGAMQNKHPDPERLYGAVFHFCLSLISFCLSASVECSLIH